MIKKYIKSIFQQYNSTSKSGKYYIDQNGGYSRGKKNKGMAGTKGYFSIVVAWLMV